MADLKQLMREEYVKCAASPAYFMKKYCYIQHPKRGRIQFNLYPFQEKVLTLFQENPYSIVLKSRQLGISTLAAGYSLWLMMFHQDKNILCIATKQDTAKNMVTKVKFMYESLPSWLKFPNKPDEANKLTLRLPNGSQIKATSASSDAGRSEAVSLLTVLQSILDTESAYCTQLQTLNIQLTSLQNQVNNLNLTKPVTVTACDSTRVTLTETPSLKTFKVNGLVPPKTILPYFGLPTDFSPTGLGIAGTETAGWAIANGNNGTINALNNFIKYGPSAITTPSGSNTVLLNATNIPPVSFTTNANFTVTGTTNEAGEHRHISRNLEYGAPACVINGDDGALPEANPSIYIEAQPDSGCATASFIGKNGIHSHTFSGSATGSFSGSTINTSVQSISVVPQHIQAIPIQWVGLC